MEDLAVSHVHSKWSYDGSWSLEALSAKFSRRGCRVLMMTEHDRGFSASRLDEYRNACALASSDKILVLPGIEYSDVANRTHVLVWGKIPFLGEGLATTEMLKAARAADGLAVLAHPSRRDAWRSFEPHWGDHLLGIEVWNRKYDGWAPSRTAPALLGNAGAVPFVGLDFHTQRQSFPLTMVLDIDTKVTEEAVLNCMRLRRCYAQAFGRPLDQVLVRKALPVLNMAERTRKTVATVARRSRLFSR
jgi:hypothetical protein